MENGETCKSDFHFHNNTAILYTAQKWKTNQIKEIISLMVATVNGFRPDFGNH